MRGSGDGAGAVHRWEIQLRKGSLELAILASLGRRERLYGLEIVRELSRVPGLAVPEGTVYPLLARLRSEGWLEAEWVEADAGHPRKYYRLTPTGRRHLFELERSWRSFAAGLGRLLDPLGQERPE